jgi:hypothetical protein
MIILAAIYLAICGLATALTGVALLFEARGDHDKFVSRLGTGLLICGPGGVVLAVVI